jgi:DNA helicase HerA-like ATPase
MSQVGTFVVHRLISDADRAVVERASGEIDRAAADFLPTLSPGQAVVIGVDFPMPLMIQIRRPTREPDAQGPDFQTYWR